jgi:hypothetical protein
MRVPAPSFGTPPGRIVRVGLLYAMSPNFDPATNRFDRELGYGADRVIE